MVSNKTLNVKHNSKNILQKKKASHKVYSRKGQRATFHFNGIVDPGQELMSYRNKFTHCELKTLKALLAEMHRTGRDVILLSQENIAVKVGCCVRHLRRCLDKLGQMGLLASNCEISHYTLRRLRYILSDIFKLPYVKQVFSDLFEGLKHFSLNLLASKGDSSLQSENVRYIKREPLGYNNSFVKSTDMLKERRRKIKEEERNMKTDLTVEQKEAILALATKSLPIHIVDLLKRKMEEGYSMDQICALTELYINNRPNSQSSLQAKPKRFQFKRAFSL